MNFSKIFFCLLGTLQAWLPAHAQFEPQFSHYNFNTFQFNPAYAGAKDGLELSLLHRSQYVSLTTRAIATQYLGINLPIYRISSAVGITIVNDLIGYQRSTSVNANYAYRKSFSAGTISIGACLGFIQTGLQGDELVTPQGEYKNGIDHKDIFVPATLQNGIAPDFSVGIRWGNEKYHFGISANHLYSFASLKTLAGNSRINYARHLSFTGGYRFVISKNFAITPAALIKTDFIKVQAELTVMMNVYRNILTGLAFRGYEGRSVDAAILYAGFNYKGFRLLYSYDINISYLSKFNSGSHEVSLAYLLPMKKRVEKGGYYYHNARFL